MTIDKDLFIKILNEVDSPGVAGSIKEAAHGKIYSENPKEPNNPEVLVVGMYRTSLDDLKKEIKNTLKDVIDRIDKDNFSGAIRLLDGMLDAPNKPVGVVSHQIRALIDVQTELQSKKKK